MHPFENIPLRKSDTKDTEYTKQFEDLLAEGRKYKGHFINIYYGDGFSKDTVNYESFCEEFIRARNAPTVSDPEVLGKYSPSIF